MPIQVTISTSTVTVPIPPFDWPEADVLLLIESWRSTMKRLAKNTPIKSEEYRYCLEKGQEVMREKMVELNFSTNYVKMPHYSETYLLVRYAVPHFMTKFLQQLETVFTGNNEIKIRNKLLPSAVGVATSTADVSVPEATEDWDGEAHFLYSRCQSAMTLLENNPTIKSEKYKRCLQKGRNVIIDTMMKIIMGTEKFWEDSPPPSIGFDWKSTPKVLATFIHHLETVFTGGKDLQLGRKATAFPPRASLVALVEEPERRKKCEILRTYVELKSFTGNDIFLLKVFQGKRSLNEELAKEGKTYNPSEEAKAVLCMHLWSLMRYVGFSKSEKVWESIRKGWPECVSWEKGRDGKFWKIIRSDQLESRVADAYKDMEKYFKEDSKH